MHYYGKDMWDLLIVSLVRNDTFEKLFPNEALFVSNTGVPKELTSRRYDSSTYEEYIHKNCDAPETCVYTKAQLALINIFATSYKAGSGKDFARGEGITGTFNLLYDISSFSNEKEYLKSRKIAIDPVKKRNEVSVMLDICNRAFYVGLMEKNYD